MVRVTKQERKYKKQPEAVEQPASNLIYKVLINGANFLKKTYATHEEAEGAALEFCKGSNSTYMIVGSRK